MKNMEHKRAEHVIELPQNGYFKVVQIYVGNEPYLPFGEMNKYHRDILKKFLESKNIDFDIRIEMGNELPLEIGKGYAVAGMGHFYIFDKKVVFTGESSDYGTGINPKHIEKCKPYFKDNDLEIKIK